MGALGDEAIVAVPPGPAGDLATAEAGQKPGAMAAEIIRVTATIVSIDKQTPKKVAAQYLREAGFTK